MGHDPWGSPALFTQKRTHPEQKDVRFLNSASCAPSHHDHALLQPLQPLVRPLLDEVLDFPQLILAARREILAGAVLT